MSGNIALDTRRINTRLLVPSEKEPKTLGPIIGYAQVPLLPLIEACEPLINIVHDLMKYASTALINTPDHPDDGLTRDESASIRLYTMEWTGAHGSLYSILNHTLKTLDREHLQPWFYYLKLLLTALTKIPCVSVQTIWRGVRLNISDDFLPGAAVIWWAFSSCTNMLTVLEDDLYLGTTGERTLFSIEVCNGRNIRAHSHFETEDEVVLLPGTYMEVQSKINPASDLHIIHLKQKVPKEILLEPPFEGNFNILHCLS